MLELIIFAPLLAAFVFAIQDGKALRRVTEQHKVFKRQYADECAELGIDPEAE